MNDLQIVRSLDFASFSPGYEAACTLSPSRSVRARVNEKRG